MIFDDDEEFSGSDSDDGFQEDMEALKKACLLFGKDADDLQPSSSIGDGHVAGADNVTPSVLGRQTTMTMTSKGDEDDDFETLRAIQRRFAAYDDDSGNGREESPLDKFEQVGVTNITGKETSNNFFLERTNAEEGFPACVDGTIQISEGCSNDVAGSRVSLRGHDSGAETTAVSKEENGAGAVTEARCSCPVNFFAKARFSAKLQGKKLSAINCGPPENSHVASFREALTHFAVSLSRKVSQKRVKILRKNLKQQFQVLLQRSVNLLRNETGNTGDLILVNFHINLVPLNDILFLLHVFG
ncbi:Myb-like DNA-binding domain protein [Datura stramonium]|uniref:Myb-like DNA-binding domain protein n=1 Tax=Datura stramonium TaxID=4076 RepID=A0ABS8RM22_DATST|nr:Myb-like DNA-binding domain protein [Datura stramonium]